jgi:hypothetical protein
MENIDKLRDELNRVAADICLCQDPDERVRLIRKVDEIAGRIPPDTDMIFYQWRHCGTA